MNQSDASPHVECANTQPMETTEITTNAVHEQDLVSSPTDIAVFLTQAIIDGKEQQVLDQLNDTNIKCRINDRIPMDFLTCHNLGSDMEWTSAIDSAVLWSSLKEVRALVSAGASVYHINSWGLSALHSVCGASQHQMEKLSYFVELDKDLVQSTDTKERTCLHVAAAWKQLEICNALLQHGADIHARDDDGATCVHYATSGNRPKILDFLLKHGAHIDACTNDGIYPIHYSAYFGATEALIYLLEKGVDINCPERDTQDRQLHLAAKKGQTRCVQELLKRGTSVNLMNKNGMLYCIYITKCVRNVNISNL